VGRILVQQQTLRRVSKDLGINISVLRHRVLQANGGQPFGHHRYRKTTAQELQRGIDMVLKDGLTGAEAARRIGIAKSTFFKHFQRVTGIRHIGPSVSDVTVRVPEKQTDLAYLAGIVDGEGSIINSKGQRTTWHLQVSNTDTKLVNWLKQFGGNVSARYTHHPRDRNRPTKRAYVWTVRRMMDVYVMLQGIRPYLVIKQGKADDCIAALTIRLHHLAPNAM
jgi:transposase-like protein